MKTIHTFILSAILLTGIISSCDENDPPLPDNLVAFEADQLGFDDETSLTINVKLTREAESDITLPITVATTDVVYDVDFATDPPLEGSTLTLPVAKGSTSASFIIMKKDNVVLDGDESITFRINEAIGNLVIGSHPELKVSFSEIIAQQGAMEPNVGGQAQPNKVFVDLSANRQISFDRSDWDLGFYTAEGQFRVILNSSSAMMVRSLEKNDLNAVTAEDTVGWSAQLSTEAVFAAITTDPVPDWAYTSGAWIDDPAGDMTKTAIGEVAATEADNKVYIVNRGKNPDGTARGWKKIRIVRNGNNYTLQHADISATFYTTVEVTRNADYLFNYVKFENGLVDLEPKKDKWDIAFTVFTNTAAAGPGLVVPYVFNDIVLQNRYETQTAEVMISSGGSYEDFDESDVASLTFTTSQLGIGSKWRTGGGPSSAPALRTDRFYVVKDADGNIYKLRFTALTQNGERGRPKIEFALVKKG